MALGTVKWFNNQKGYGFICPLGSDTEIFAHFSSIEMEGYKTLKAGQTVSYELQDGPKGAHALHIRAVTEEEFADVWYDSAMETAMSVFLSVGTQNYLIGNHGDSRYYATVARFFEQIMTASKQSQAYQNWPKLLETHKADLHTLVKFFRHRIPCSCLDEKYEEVKSITKLGFCYNPDCKFSIVKGEGVERSKAKYCSRCRCVTYCSRECQVACWTEHKPDCE